MEQTVYADVLFLVNFSMDFLVLYICAALSRRRLFALRCACASAIGGAYGVGALFIPDKGALPLICDIAALFVICAVAYAKREMGSGEFLGQCAIFAGVSAILGGIMTMIYSALNRSGISELGSDSHDDISVWLFAVIAAAGGAATFVGGKRLKRLAIVKETEVSVSFGSGEVSFRAMTDTGNLLTDPLSGRGVLLCELDAVRKVFPKELCEMWENGVTESASSLPAELAAAIRFIPARGAVSRKQRILAAVDAEVFAVTPEGKRISTDLLIAPVPQRLSAGACRGLLPAGII